MEVNFGKRPPFTIGVEEEVGPHPQVKAELLKSTLEVANIDQSSTITVTCTTGAAYNVGLDGGGSGNINARRMINGTNNVGYQLYSNSARTNVWGNTVGTDTVAGSGNGTSQTLTVYGRVPPQTTPVAAVYNDTVNVTVTY